MNSLTGSILIDFQNMPVSEQQKEYHKQVYGAIKLHISEMQKYQKISHFNMCNKCGMILTQEDKNLVYDCDQICSNEKQFKEVIEKYKEELDNIVVWICKFCEMKNVIQCDYLKLARNNSRVVEKPPIENNQKKDPILLILFDISGSMQEVITNEQSVHSSLIQKIKGTKIYKKIVQEEEDEIKEFITKQSIKESIDNKQKYKDFLKKNKLLMGLTQWLVNQINPNGNNKNQKMNRQGNFSSNKDKKAKVNKTIGLMFFNSNVIIEPTNGSKQKTAVVVCDHKEGYCEKTEHMSRERVNFDDFQSMFKLGAVYGTQYTTKLTDFKFQNHQFRFGDSSHSQTALGPALVMALGVISQHGAGSSIVIVTDGIGNKGIFDQSQRWQQSIRLLKYHLQKNKCFLTVLQCRNLDQKSKQKDKNNIKTCLDQFCLKNQDSVAKKINIIFDKNKKAQELIEDIKKKMSVSINRDHIMWTNEVKIKCQNPNVTFQQEIQKLSQKLYSQQQAVYINPKIDLKKLQKKDYMHHFMTQTVIRYQNTQTGQQSIFLTYILQKFVQYNNLKRNTIKKLDNEKTFRDLMEYLSAEEQNYDISNIPLSFVKKTFRDTLMFSKSIYNKSLRFPLKGQNEHKQEDVLFFEQIMNKGTINQENEQSQNDIYL